MAQEMLASFRKPIISETLVAFLIFPPVVYDADRDCNNTQTEGADVDGWYLEQVSKSNESTKSSPCCGHEFLREKNLGLLGRRYTIVDSQ